MSSESLTSNESSASIRGNPARSFRQDLDELDPLARRVGQFVACRPDLLAAEENEHLLTIVDDCDAEPWDVVAALIAADFEAPVGELFDWINRVPQRAGVLVQEHDARLLDGTDVTVRILRPAARDIVEKAISLERVIDRVAELGGLDAAERTRLDADARDWLLNQIDFERERRMCTRLNDSRVHGQNFRFPVPIADFCTPRVFTFERMDGVALLDLIPIADRADNSFRDLGLHRPALADTMFLATLNHVFGLGLFPEFLHPSALIAMSGDEIGVTDLAAMSRIDVSVRDRYLSLVSAIRTGDVDRIVGSSTSLIGASDRDANHVIRSEFRARAAVVARELELDGTSAAPLGRYLRSFIEISRRHGVQVAAESSAATSAVLTAENVAKQFTSEASLRRVSDRFFLRLQLRAVGEYFDVDNAQALGLDLLELVTTVPGKLASLLSDLADDRFILQVASSESEDDRRAGHARARLIAAAIALVALAVIFTGPDVAGAPSAVRIVAAGLIGVSAAAFAILWSRLR